MALTFPAFQHAQLRHPSWLAASDAALATWLKLICRCGEDENGGRIAGARTWTERMFIGAANVGLEGVSAAVSASLCSWDGDDLVVWGYDLDAEAKARKSRQLGGFGILGAEHGKKGGRPRKDGKPPGSENQKPPLKPPLSSPSPSDPIRTDPSGSGARASQPVVSAGLVPPLGPVVTRSRVFLAAKSLAFLSVAEKYPNQHRLNEAAQTWQELVLERGIAEQALANEILAAFRAGFLKRHPYDGEPRFVPKLESFLANQSWTERAPKKGPTADEDAYPEET